MIQILFTKQKTFIVCAKLGKNCQIRETLPN